MKIGYCLTGSFCTFAKSLEALEALVRAGHTITPIMSQTAYTTDTRFGDAVDIQNRLPSSRQCQHHAKQHAIANLCRQHGRELAAAAATVHHRQYNGGEHIRKRIVTAALHL